MWYVTNWQRGQNYINCDTLRVTQGYLEDNILSNINIAEERMYITNEVERQIK